MKKHAHRLLVSLFALLPYKTRIRLHDILSISLGQGWVSGSIDQEVRGCLALLKHDPNKDLFVFDVGANHGDWADSLLRQYQGPINIAAFEPGRLSFENLQQRFQGDSRVRLENMALGSRTEIATLWMNHEGSTLASMNHRDLTHIGFDFSISEKVQVTTLDTWCKENQFVPTILKLDVEGFELEVLRGARESMRLIRVIQWEFGGANVDSGTFFRDYFNYFSEHNFSLFRLTPRGLVSISKYSERDETFRATNYFAVNLSAEV